jgi:hypothetical protein
MWTSAILLSHPSLSPVKPFSRQTDTAIAEPSMLLHKSFARPRAFFPTKTQ